VVAVNTVAGVKINHIIGGVSEMKAFSGNAKAKRGEEK
jgi:hypothetical protein